MQRTVFLGVGSNLGDRMGFMRRAFQEMLQAKLIEAPIRVSRIYEGEALVPADAPESWKINFFNAVIEARTTLEPQQLLSELKQIEKKLGRDDRERWAPRKIDLDILWGEGWQITEPHLHIPHSGLLFRSFWLKPLSELRQELAMNGGSVSISDLAAQMTEPPVRALPVSLLPVELVGIVNVTPDSFSDGGLYDEPVSAFRRIREMVEQGASIIDIGAESTRPGAERISHEEEWKRIGPVLQEVKRGLREEYSWIKWSVDTRHVETAERLGEFHVDWVNDVTGGDSSRMVDSWLNSKLDIVFMHHLGVPVDPSRVIPAGEDPVDFLKKWAFEKKSLFERVGISSERLVFDPGIGFGKLASQSVEILNRLDEFSELNLRVLVGHSRKSFLSQITDLAPAMRDLETHMISSRLARKGLDYLRIHEVKGTERAIKADLLVQ